ncbi:MAG: SNF2-related protein [Clostridia bacterium]|nr:SNF2-related protein [Clostridia bacterium]
MENKLKLITSIYEETTKDISKDGLAWIEFLNCASMNYKYSFKDQVLIFAQKPDAKACANIETWNKSLNRWVNKGAKGIALINEDNGYTNLRYVFDVSDTNNKYGKEVKLWTVSKELEDVVIESLENKFGELELKTNLTEAIKSVSEILIQDNYIDYFNDFLNYRENSFLEKLDAQIVEKIFKEILINNVAFVMLKRCGIEPIQYFNVEDFAYILNFNTAETINRIGVATSDISEMGLKEIYNTIKNVQINEINKNRTFVNQDKMDYYINKSRETAKRSDDHEYNLQSSGGLSNTEFDIATKEKGTSNGEILTNEIKSHQEEQQRSIHNTTDKRSTYGTFSRNTENSRSESRADNRTNGNSRESGRTDEITKSNAVGRQNEQLQNDSRRNSNERIDIQLEDIIDKEMEEYKPPFFDANKLPDVNEQLNLLNDIENTTTDKFVFPQEVIDITLQKGSGFQQGKYRIYEQLLKCLSSKDNIEFLKDEYGLGGSSSVAKNSDIGENHGTKGITLYKGYGENSSKIILSWNQVESRLKELINSDRYLNEKEKQYYPIWLDKKEQEIQINDIDIPSISLAERLNDFLKEFDYYEYLDNVEIQESELDTIEKLEEQLENPEQLKGIIKYLRDIYSETENEDKEIVFNLILELEELYPNYEYKLGDKVYIGAEEYEILSFDDDIVRLYDYKYPLFNKEFSRKDFDNKVRENPVNNHLIKKTEYIQKENNEVITDIVDENQIIPTLNKKTKVTSFDIYPDIKNADRLEYKIDNELLGTGTPREKFSRNIEAIKVLKKCETENCFATKEEQDVLSKYLGWGGLSQAFDDKNTSWANEYLELKSLLDEEEYKNARESTLTAFYTPPIVIKSMYKVLENVGYKNGNILEPSCGTGNFLGMIPDSLKECKLYGIELDSISGKIARQLYQKTSIAIQGFEETSLPDSFFDGAIGNVPFGDFKLLDKKYDKNKFLIHDYFFAKTLDKVRPGGIIAFISSKGTLDKENPSVRKYIASRADLLGAIRLPNNTFKNNAGTEVTTDIIFLQKRDSITDIMPNWVYLDTNENGIKMNKYYIDNPEMILGEMVIESTQYGFDSTCKADETEKLEDLLNNAITNIHAQIKEYVLEDAEEELDLSIPADYNVRNFSYTLLNGDDIYYRENSRMYPQELPVTTANRIKGLIEIRDCVRLLIEMQTEDYPDDEIKKAQLKLNTLYDTFNNKYGLINSRANNSAFSNDNSYYLLCSLEILNENGELSRKADMFTKRTIKPHKEIKSVDSSNEALIVSISEKARVDIEFMCSLTNKSEDEIINDLEGLIFRVPSYDETIQYVTADEYLSGNVREKLKIAKSFAEQDYIYNSNVKYLREVQPVDLTPSEISVRLGATWLPAKDVENFIFNLLTPSSHSRYNIKVHYFENTSEWNIEGKNYDRMNVKAFNTYGTSRMNAYKIIEETLNLKDVRVYDYIEDEEGKKKQVLNKKETAIAQSKQEQIKMEFEEWIWSDSERRERLSKIYNEKFNSIRAREYDGKHISLSGINPEITLRKHQLDAIARILYGGNTLLAHEVGAGKTYEMVGAAMELKRLNLCNKSLFVVPNHIVEQFSSEFLQLYPSANILVTSKKDFETANRKKFCSRIATGDYDAVIISHSQFEKIPMSVERQKVILEKEIEEVTYGISDLKRNRGENFSIKQLEKTKKTLQNKLNKLNDQSRKDNVVTFEELGVDRIFIDEAHYFKNLFLYTKMRNVGGIAQTEAQKSSDLYMKCRYLDEITGGKGIIFATGTPISNSMVELYTLQRYLQYNSLEKNKLQHFDSWASTFGETVTAIELAPEGTGYRAKTRFAKFYNLPELMSIFKEVADIQTAEMLKLPVPKANYESIVVKPSEIQTEMVKELADRAESVRNKMVDASTDNMLKITNDGRKLALDQRLTNNMLEDYELSKVATCATNVYDIWDKYSDKKLTQMIFCDLSTPNKDDRFNVYDDIKNKLILKGIPSEEIAFIHSADNDLKKKELFSKVRNGQVRVLMGSTQKMGAGTNCQDKLIALHDLDCPWRPSDLIQRSGRIIRQGNQNEEVYIYRYVTEGTFDAYLYQLVENKQRFISQIMTDKSPVRYAEDIDETALSYAEIKALAAGNSLIIEKTELDTKVAKLRLLKQNHLSQLYALEDRIVKFYPSEIKRLELRIEGIREDLKVIKQNPKVEENSSFKMILNQKSYIEKADAGKMLIDICKTLNSIESKLIGEYRGFKMEIRFETFDKTFHLYLKNKYSYDCVLGTDINGNITRIDNTFESIEKLLNSTKGELENVRLQYENAKQEVKKEFPQESELKEKSKRLDELNILLNMNEKDNQIIDGPDLKESQICEKSYER